MIIEIWQLVLIVLMAMGNGAILYDKWLDYRLAQYELIKQREVSKEG